MSLETDLAWLGGIIDGEGSIPINLKPKRGGYHFCRIIIVNTDEGLVAEVKRILDNLVIFYTTHIKPRSDLASLTRKTCYIIEVNRQREAIELAKLLLPYLKSYKRGRCLEVIEYEKIHTHDKIGRRLNLRHKKSL